MSSERGSGGTALPLRLFAREPRDVGDLDCPDFDRSKGTEGERGCDSDGHYRCKECRYFNRESPIVTGDWGHSW
jgi:hypothetical protein